MTVKVKEIEINFKWWQPVLAIIVFMLMLRINSNEIIELVKLVLNKLPMYQ